MYGARGVCATLPASDTAKYVKKKTKHDKELHTRRVNFPFGIILRVVDVLRSWRYMLDMTDRKKYRTESMTQTGTYFDQKFCPGGSQSNDRHLWSCRRRHSAMQISIKIRGAAEPGGTWKEGNKPGDCMQLGVVEIPNL